MNKVIYIFISLIFFSQTSFGLEIQRDVVLGDCQSIKSEFKEHLSCVQRNLLTGQCSVNLSCVSPHLKKAAGSTFSALGPNCFASAIYGANLRDSFRGVSALEFTEVLKASCTQVETPKTGDIGIYYVEDFGPSHAYTFISENIVFEKPGVDYLGQTPMRFNFKNVVDFTHVASDECRRWGDESCHSKQAYYRCSEIKLPSDFQKTLDHLDSIIDSILTSQVISEKQRQSISPFYLKLYSTLNSLAKTPLEKAIVRSIRLQFEFLGKELDIPSV